MIVRNKLIAAVVLGLAIIAVLFWWRFGTLSPTPVQTPSPQAAPRTEPQPGQGNAEASNSAAKLTEPTPPLTQKPSPELRRTFETLNHNAIVFYGRAVDQFGEPVVGADVRGTVLVNTGTRGGSRKAKTTTDGLGYFQFGDLVGQDIGIMIAKDGYEYRRKSSSFSYSYFEADHKRHIPDPKNPVVFVLWKKKGAETLVHYEKVWRFPLSGGPLRIDLTTGKVAERDADLVVTVSRTPLVMPYGTTGFAWQAAVDVTGGGLIRVGELDYYNAAPETGYEPRLQHMQEARSVREAQEGRIKWTWQEDVADTFFISCRDGRIFARVYLRIKPNSDHKEGDNEALVAAGVWLNPNGSRNLEFDPKNAITPKP
jgi:hypothetical protein